VQTSLVDVDEVVAEAASFAGTKLAGRREGMVSIELAPGAPPRIPIHSVDLLSSLVNLVGNSIDAMPAGGKVSIATGIDDEGVWVRVSDNGPGMSPEVEQRVFEPFFTTKGDDGTGLGLAMVYAFMQRSGGRVTLKTAPGAGASFTLVFPKRTVCESPPTSAS
jgi:signal transduction histidine kinase